MISDVGEKNDGRNEAALGKKIGKEKKSGAQGRENTFH